MSYNPCLSEEEIATFEHRHCITLPDDYRIFISEIGNGGFGPGHGLLPLDKAIVDFKLRDKPNISLNKEFPYQDKWNEEWIAYFDWDEEYPETEIVDAYISTTHIAGCLQISHFGHGCTLSMAANVSNATSLKSFSRSAVNLAIRLVRCPEKATVFSLLTGVPFSVHVLVSISVNIRVLKE